MGQFAECGNWTFREHANSRTRRFAALPIRGREDDSPTDVSLTSVTIRGPLHSSRAEIVVAPYGASVISGKKSILVNYQRLMFIDLLLSYNGLLCHTTTNIGQKKLGIMDSIDDYVH